MKRNKKHKIQKSLEKKAEKKLKSMKMDKNSKECRQKEALHSKNIRIGKWRKTHKSAERNLQKKTGEVT